MRAPKFAPAFLLTIAACLSVSPIAARGQAPHRLTLEEAIERGLRHNLRVLVAGTHVEEAEGTRQRRFSALLPHARGEALVNMQTRNLRAFGIDIPGAPDIIGPFSSYDFRLRLDQPILDLESFHRWKASEKREGAARQDYQDIRDLIIRQVAALYLNAQAIAARVEAARARVATAEALDTLARDQREAGVATGVDVLRAQVQLANEKQRLLELRNSGERALLALARAVGLDLGTPLELAQSLEFKPVLAPQIPGALESALDARADYHSLKLQWRALVDDEKSNRARWFPKLSFTGDYGAIGRTLGSVRGTGALQGTLSVTLFDWDREGQRTEFQSRRRRLEHQMEDLRRGIEQEIREALLNLDSAAEEVSVAQQGLRLAERELALARDRFQSGVTNNVEVIQAQDSVARAQENHIVAVTHYTDAKSALARALGATEEIYRYYLGIE